MSIKIYACHYTGRQSLDWDSHDLWPIIFNFVFVQSLAEELKSKAQSLGLKSVVVDLKNYEPEDSLSEEVKIYFWICGL